jgi:guanylate kinase
MRSTATRSAELSPHGRVLVVSGPSGVGKDTVLDRLLAPSAGLPGLTRCVTATTRPPRAGEVDGIDYVFMTETAFSEAAGQDAFLEHAVYSGYRYGTPRRSVETLTAAGSDVVLKIEVQGALLVRAACPDAVLIFIGPPTWNELEMRLMGRSTDEPEQVQERLRIARDELRAASQYDYYVVNDRLSDALAVIRAIVVAERHRVAPIRGGTSSCR